MLNGTTTGIEFYPLNLPELPSGNLIIDVILALQRGQLGFTSAHYRIH